MPPGGERPLKVRKGDDPPLACAASTCVRHLQPTRAMLLPPLLFLLPVPLRMKGRVGEGATPPVEERVALPLLLLWRGSEGRRCGEWEG